MRPFRLPLAQLLQEISGLRCKHLQLSKVTGLDMHTVGKVVLTPGGSLVMGFWSFGFWGFFNIKRSKGGKLITLDKSRFTFGKFFVTL